MDFGTATYEDLDQHAMEQLVFDGGAISPILRGHLFVEAVLDELLRRNLPRSEALFRRNNVTFDLKIDLARSLDVISEEYVSLFRAINRVRNNYAHQTGYQVSFEELNGFKWDWNDLQQKAYNKVSEKGVDEAARLAVIFLCWDAIRLIKEPEKNN